ncbi:MAG: radical SAM protein [Prevotellaceae bacterium]|jgi:uncharacterized protein|nr:radical SAM protein [Prevotellaceae bacterium]
MKWSKFNILFKISEFNFLYNSKSNSFFKLENDLYREISLLESGEKAIDSLSPETYELLKSKDIIVGDYDDENFISQMLFLKRKTQFNGTTLGLVIAPTLGCNFRCPYCYESGLPSNRMKADVQEQLLEFINLHKIRTKDLSIYWHGGEPLLAFNTMKSLFYKIREKSEIPVNGHRMVTNGYLFNLKMCSFFKETNLNYVQITVDGTEETHNANRIHKSGVPTYQKIIENIDMITDEMPNCKVGVRVNIHNDNKWDYPNIYYELSERWKGKNCSVYPAFVIPQTGCKVSCLSSTEKMHFYTELYRKYNFKDLKLKPSIKSGACSAIYEHHYIIDPEGFLFKCWADFGLEDRKIGHISSGITNWKFVSEYMVNSDKFVDEKCLKCRVFPICEGGCNRFRVDKNYLNIPYNVCPIDETGLIDYLRIIYEQTIKNEELRINN